MSHAEVLAAFDRRLDAVLSGTANFVDLTDDSPEALELQQLLTAARLTIQVLGEPLSPVTRTRHMRMLEAAAAGPDCRPGHHLGRHRFCGPLASPMWLPGSEDRRGDPAPEVHWL
jgi:hypothetical protein